MDASAQLQALLDKEAIREVVYRYCRAIDRRDRALLKTCFHPDATADYGRNGGPNGELDLLFKSVEATSPNLIVMNHHIGNIMIELDGDRAAVESYLIDTLQMRTDANMGADQGLLHQLIARYLDVFERRDGEWRILRRVVVKDLRDVRTFIGFEEGYRPGRADNSDVAYDPERK